MFQEAVLKRPGMVYKIIILLLIVELVASAGQILYKKALNKIKPKSYIDFLKSALSSIKIWAGFCLIAISLILWIAALSLGDLNFVYSLGSLQYIIILIGARAFLGENIDRYKLIGTILIIFGIILISLT